MDYWVRMLLEWSWTLSIVAPAPRLEWKRLACCLAYSACLHSQYFEVFMDQNFSETDEACVHPRARLDAALLREVREASSVFILLWPAVNVCKEVHVKRMWAGNVWFSSKSHFSDAKLKQVFIRNQQNPAAVSPARSDSLVSSTVNRKLTKTQRVSAKARSCEWVTACVAF